MNQLIYSNFIQEVKNQIVDNQEFTISQLPTGLIGQMSSAQFEGVAVYQLSDQMPEHLKNILPDAEALKKLLQ